MQISKTEEHGLRLVMRLAAHGGQLTVGELSEAENLPEPTVAKVLLGLRRAGLVRAERGRNGGYTLARRPEEISVGEVLESVGEPLFEGRFCQGMELPTGRACPHEDACGIRPVWQYIETMVMRVLSGTTLADVLEGEAAVRRHVDALGSEARDPSEERELPVLVADGRTGEGVST